MKLGSMVTGIVMIVIALLMFGIVLDAIHDVQTDDQADADLAITGTPPAGLVTLTEDLWQTDTDNVLSIVGNGTEEAGAITAVSYAASVLTMTGVTDSTTATVTYEIDGLTAYTGMGPLAGIAPLIIFIGLLAGGGWLTFRGIAGGREGGGRGRSLH